MKVCIVGLGAIGGLFGARLAQAGCAVSALVRGQTLAAVARDGLQLQETIDGVQRTLRVNVTASDDARVLGEQDLVVLAVKTTGLADVVQGIAPLLGRSTSVLSAMNGVPWWFTHGLGEAARGLDLEVVDPQGVVSRAVPPERVIGCVTHLSAGVGSPGVIRAVAGKRLLFGEPLGAHAPGHDAQRGTTARCQAVIDACAKGGFQCELVPSIQQEIWYKLWGNMTVNPISAMTGATGDATLADPFVRAFMSSTMVEAAEIGRRIGLPISMTPEERHAITDKLGVFRPSMLNDVAAGKPVELDALVTIVSDLGRQLGVPTPNINTLLGLTRMFARTHGLYPREDAARGRARR